MNQEAEAAVSETLNGLQENTQKVLLEQIAVNRKLREVLKFYSNPENMRRIALFDQGKVARTALGVST